MDIVIGGITRINADILEERQLERDRGNQPMSEPMEICISGRMVEAMLTWRGAATSGAGFHGRFCGGDSQSAPTSAATASVKLSVDSWPPRSRVRTPWRSRSSVAFLTAWPTAISPSW